MTPERLGQPSETAKRDPMYVLGQIRATQRWQSWATALLFTGLVAGLIYIYIITSSINDSLCAVRGDFENRIVSTKKFLQKNPHGFGGLSAEELLKSEKDQERTVASLSNLHCGNQGGE